MALTRRYALILFSATALTGAAAATTFLASPTSAGGKLVYAEGGIAIDGTDTVAYFNQGKPVAGSPDITHEWKGATWRFSTEENRAAFAANPAAYAPQYGGYCAYAVSEGYTASTVPEAWKIVEGKLYLNYSTGVQKRWEKNYSERIVAADGYWPKIAQ
ncbi:MAG: YHS domain-containing (seleno)protein [Pseudomonadota bacterium]